jgi:phage terminase small subunit
MTEKEKIFVAEYLKDLNGAAACRRMGYAPASAGAAAHRLRRSKAVEEAIRKALEAELPGSEERILRELWALACGESSDANGAALKTASKLRALELIGKHLGMFDGSGREKQAPVTIVEDVG